MLCFDDSTIQRFWSKVNRTADSSACWEWMAALDSKGYGQHVTQGKRFIAHRFSFLSHYGFLSPGKVICHTCDNRACVNPHHLWEGTQKENLRDSRKKNRLGNPDFSLGEVWRPTNRSTGGKTGSKLTPCDVLYIKALKLEGKRSGYSIAKQFGVVKSCIYGIWRGERWKDIDV